MNKATTEGSTEAVKLPANVCLVASRFFFAYDEKYGEFRKRIHSKNPRYAELKGIVDDPGYVPAGDREFHGRILQACDVYDTSFFPKNHTIVTVCGGYNGGGGKYSWCEYLDEIKGSIRRLVDAFGGAWLVDLHEHSDVWYAEIGFNDYRGVPADGSDHTPCASDDFLAFAKVRETAVAAERPFGLVDWGHRGYDWAWAKMGGPWSCPRTAFHGALINPTRTANHFEVFDADADCFRSAYGVYEAHNGTPAFYAVATTSPGGFGALSKLQSEDIWACGELPPKALPLLEDWQPRPHGENSTAG